MIVDRLIARWPAMDRLFVGAHIVQVPYRVCPYDDTDGRPGLLWSEEVIPTGLKPMRTIHNTLALDASYADPPYDRMVFIGSEDADPGCLFLSARRVANDDALKYYESSATMVPELRVFIEAGHDLLNSVRWRVAGALIMMVPNANIPSIGPFSLWIGQSAIMPMDALGDETKISQVSDEVLRPWVQHYFGDILRYYDVLGFTEEAAWVRARLATLGSSGGRSLREVWSEVHNDRNHYVAAVVTGLSLLNARNIVQREVRTPHTRASRRRGERPPYVFHILRVHVPKRPHESHNEPAALDHRAVHWVRGHFKEYTAEHPLFGRHTGLYWWQPHLAGRDVTRVVEKRYEIVAESNTLNTINSTT